MTLPFEPQPPEPGTPDETLEYGAREAASPGIQEFRGGDAIVISVSLVTILLIVLIVVLLSRD